MKKKYNPIVLGNTKGLPDDEWLQWRDHGPFYKDPTHPHYVKTGIGGSDVSIIFNVSPFRCSLELFHQKTRVKPKITPKQNTDALESGHIFEPFVGQMFVRYMKEIEKVEIEYIEDFNLYQCGEPEVDEYGNAEIDMDTGYPKLKYPFALGNLDARCRIKENGIWKNYGVELKTTTCDSFNFEVIRDWQNGIVPIYYELQCRYYMAITNLPAWYICCCWGMRLKHCAVVKIERDLEIEKIIMETVKEFVEKIENNTEPDISECKAELFNRYYENLYGLRDDTSRVIELDADEYLDIFKEAAELDELITKKEKELDAIKRTKEEIYKKLYPVYKESKCGKIVDGNKTYYLTLKQPMKRAAIDTGRLKVENPDLYNEYSSVETKEKFDTTSFKKKCPGEYSRYLLPPERSDDPNKAPTFTLSITEAGA